MKCHTIKHTHSDGKELDKPISWCGVKLNSYDSYFLDAHHLTLSVGGSRQSCKKCINAVVRELQKEL